MRMLIVFIAIGLTIAGMFLLKDGVYIGSSLERIQRADGEAFLHKCRYLLFSGIYETANPPTAFYNPSQATGLLCPTRLF